MAVKVISIETLKDAKRQGTFEQKVPFTLNHREYAAIKRIVNGETEVFSFNRPLGEMITTDAVRKELMEKVVLDVELGREATPVLFTPIYERLEDSNFPEVFEAKWAQRGVVVFAEHIEGQEVRFGHLQAEQGPIARIVTYAAGIEYTEDMVEYNRTFDMEEINRAFGEAYNALLNHLHLGPIITYSYANANKTASVLVDVEGNPAPSGYHKLLSLRETLKQGLADARKEKRPGTILLVAGERLEHVQEALGSFYVRGTDYPPLSGIEQIVAYDGWEAEVGKKKVTYNGVVNDKAYLIRPKRGFKELIKHDLRIDATMPDLSRLIEAQIVGRARRGVFAALPENVQEITLPDF